MDPWIPSSNDSKIFAKKNFPEDSGGSFFPKGWLSGETLNFIDWIKKLSKKNNTNRIVIIDPFFDVLGIEILADMEDLSNKFIVITGYVLPKKEEEKSAKEEKTRLERIEERSHELRHILSNLDLYIYCLKSKNDKSPFHDRYILLYEDDVIKEGYHLSNSIQNATRNHPLLITQITNDLIYKVNDYFDELIANKYGNFDKQELFNPNNVEVTEFKYFTPKNTEIQNIIPYPHLFFKSLIQNDYICKLCDKQLSGIIRMGFMHGNNFKLNDIICSNTEEFISELKTGDETIFNKLWLSLSEWIPRTQKSDQYTDKIIEFSDNNLVKNLYEFIINSPNNEFILDSLKKKNKGTRNVLPLLKKDFHEIIREMNNIVELSSSLWDRRFYSLHYAADVIFEIDPYMLINIFEEIQRDLSTIDKIDSRKSLIQLNAIVIIYKTIIHKTTVDNHSDFLIFLIENDIPFLRAFASQIVIMNTNEKNSDSFDLANELLINLNPIENIYILADWINDLKNDTTDFDVISNIFELMKNVWPTTVSKDELRIINKLHSGISEINNTSTLNNELLIPLYHLKKLEFEEICNLWISILLEYLNDIENNEFSFKSNLSDFTNTCGYSLTLSKDFAKHIKKINRIIGSKMRIIRTPLSFSRDPSLWQKSAESLLWIQALINYAKSYKDHKELENTNEELQELWNYISVERNPYLINAINFVNSSKI